MDLFVNLAMPIVFGYACYKMGISTGRRQAFEEAMKTIRENHKEHWEKGGGS